MARKLRAYVDIPTHLGPDVTENLSITNISLTGCLLRTDTLLKVGSNISLSVSAPGGGAMLRLRGKIVREQDEPNGYGISFDELTDDERRDLALLIAEAEEKA